MIVPINVKIQDFIEKYTTLNKPILYKDLIIYPIKMNEVYDFLENCDILTIDKNACSDIEIIQMSYLQFVFNLIVEDKNYLHKFLTILKASFKIKHSTKLYNDNYKYGELMTLEDIDELIVFFNGWDLYFSIKENNKITLFINGVEITPKEFEEIKRLIMYQNIVDYDDSYIDPDVLKIKNEYNRLKNKSITYPNIENQMAVISSETGIIKSVILDMTYREFSILFNTVVEKIDYQINKRADLQDKKFEKAVPHWIFEKNQNKLEGVLMEKGNFDAKMQNVT